MTKLRCREQNLTMLSLSSASPSDVTKLSDTKTDEAWLESEVRHQHQIALEAASELRHRVSRCGMVIHRRTPTTAMRGQ